MRSKIKMKKRLIVAVLFLIIILGILRAESFGLGGGIGVNICVGETCPENSQNNSQEQNSEETTFTNLENRNSDNKNYEILQTKFFNQEPIQLQEIKLAPVETKTPKLNLILSFSFVFMIFLSVYLIRFVV